MGSKDSASAPALPLDVNNPIHITPKKSSALPMLPDLLCSKTPEKSNPKPQYGNPNSKLSIGEVGRASQKLYKSNLSGSDVVERGTLSPDEIELKVSEELQEVIADNKMKNLEESVKLPQQYHQLCEFFNAMVRSIKLLKLRRLITTYTNVYPKVECLTDRRFTVNHLAQMKHLLPEAIVVKKIRVQDEETSCMKEELLITLDAESVRNRDNAKDSARSPRLEKVFRARIAEYFEAYLEGDDIPEEMLPVLFYPPKKEMHLSVDEITTVSAASDQSSSLSEISSREVSPLEADDTTITKEMAESSQPETPCKTISCSETEGTSCIGTAKIHETPGDLASSTPVRLMTATPSLKPDKKCYMSPDGANGSPNKSKQRSIRMSLSFDTLEKDATVEDQPDQIEDTFIDKQELDSLLECPLQSVREKEQEITEELNPAISEAKKQDRLMASLPRLFDTIHLLFQSIDRPVITREEFVYKIVSGHVDIVDRGEVEEQLKLLKEVVPDYISEKLCLSGDTLICVNKLSSIQSIREKLEAK